MSKEKRKVWTKAYQPFRMGQNPNRPISTEVEVIEEKIINDIALFSFKTGKGTIRIAEAITGGIVGNSFEEVENDLISADAEVVKKQLKSAEAQSNSSEKMSNDQFFSLYTY
jgi:hypothetical protein